MKIVFSRISIVSLMLLFFLITNSNAQLSVVPAVRDWKPSSGKISLSNSFKVATDKTNSEILNSTLTLFISEVKELSSLNPVLEEATTSKMDMVFFQVENTNKELGAEGYKIIFSDRIEIKSATVAGAFYATQTLLQLIKQQGGSFDKGTILDSPTFGTRSIMIDAGRRFYQVSYIQNLIRQMAWYKMNDLHIHFTEWSAFRLKSDTYPGLAASESYSKDDIKKILATAKKYHVVVVPEIDLPAHASAISSFNPALGFSCESMRKARWQGEEANNAGKAWTLDVTRPEVRLWIKNLLDEFIPLFDGPYFHVGGDEYQYDPEKYKCPELIAYMNKKGYAKPGDVFIEWLNEVNEQVKSYGKKTQIWSWWNFGKNSTSIQPSKDIVVNVWNKPTEKILLDDGYKIIVTPEEELYVSPGLVDTSGYGLVDCKEVYEVWKPDTNPNILGYKVCVWSDRAEFHTDQWFEGNAFEPKVILAEKVWAGQQSKTMEEYLNKVNRVGNAPYLK